MIGKQDSYLEKREKSRHICQYKKLFKGGGAYDCTWRLKFEMTMILILTKNLINIRRLKNERIKT